MTQSLIIIMHKVLLVIRAFVRHVIKRVKADDVTRKYDEVSLNNSFYAYLQSNTERQLE